MSDRYTKQTATLAYHLNMEFTASVSSVMFCLLVQQVSTHVLVALRVGDPASLLSSLLVQVFGVDDFLVGDFAGFPMVGQNRV